MGLSGHGLLGRDASHLGLADDAAQRRGRSQADVRQGVSDQEIALLRSGWSWLAEINFMGR